MLKLLTLIPEMIIKALGVFFKLLTKNLAIGLVIILGVIGFFGYNFYNSKSEIRSQLENTLNKGKLTEEKLASVSAELDTLKNEDQVKKNLELQQEIKNIQDTYKKGLGSYENIVDLKASADFKKADPKEVSEIDKLFAASLQKLADRNYTDAAKNLDEINKRVQAQVTKISPTPVPVATAPQVSGPANNTPPGSGYSRQNVNSDAGAFVVDIIAADLNSTKVIIDTASDSDCHDNCPVLALGDYVSRSGAFAGVNGSYFCPASYPQCAGKTNSYDTLLMNKNKKYFNSDNNVYSTVPAAIFSAGSARFVGQSLEWGRDTGVDGVIANQPLLLAGGNVVFGGNSDPKQGSKGSRSFVGAGGGKVYIGVVHNATVAEVARVLKAMGMSEALNLDSGGSTALWSGGYKVGPGRQIPNAVLFVGR